MALEQANRFLISQASPSSVARGPETPSGGLSMSAVQIGRRSGGCKWFQRWTRGSLRPTLPFLKRVRRSRIQVPALESRNVVQSQPPARTDCVGLFPRPVSQLGRDLAMVAPPWEGILITVCVWGLET